MLFVIVVFSFFSPFQFGIFPFLYLGVGEKKIKFFQVFSSFFQTQVFSTYFFPPFFVEFFVCFFVYVVSFYFFHFDFAFVCV